MTKYAILIDPFAKEIRLGQTEYLSDVKELFAACKYIVIENDVKMFCFPIWEINDNHKKGTFFLCLESDIKEVEAGMAVVEFDTLEKAQEYLEKFKEMVVWRF